MPSKSSLVAWIALALALAACHRDAAVPAATGTAADAEDGTPLPKPAPASGPVTGMPSRPGPGPVGPPAATTSASALPTDAALAPDASGSPTVSDAPPADANATPGATPSTSTADAIAEPTADDAAVVVRSYFSAIAGRDFARAHALEGGDASARPIAQLVADYADVATLEATVGAPGRLDAAAGSRYIRVPVAVARSLRDGSTQRLVGTATLRRSVVDGATAEQRAWRIASVDLHQAPPAQ